MRCYAIYRNRSEIVSNIDFVAEASDAVALHASLCLDPSANMCSGKLKGRHPVRCSRRATSAIVVIATQSQYQRIAEEDIAMIYGWRFRSRGKTGWIRLRSLG